MRPSQFALILWLTLSGCASSSAIMAKSKGAAGGEGWDAVRTIHWRLELHTSGLEGEVETWDDVVNGRFVDRMVLGPTRSAKGFDGTTVWSQDGSGRVRQEQGEGSRLGAVNESYRRSLAYWFPARRPAETQPVGHRQEGARLFDVVRITPIGGRPFELWLDAKTGLIDRTIEDRAIETTTVFYSDYREVQGLRVPFSVRVTNGDTQYDAHMTVAAVELNVDIDGGMFQMPEPPPPDFYFEGGKVSTSLPFRMLNNHIYLQVRLNGRGPFTVLLDTGGVNLVTPTLAKELGLKSEGALQGRGVGEASSDVGLTTIEKLSLGDVTLSDQVFAVFALEDFFQRVEGVDAVGLVGYEIFKRFVVRIDYENNVATLTLPSAHTHPSAGTVVPFEMDGHLPSVDGSIDGFAGKFDIDTGSRSSVDLMGPFVQKFDLEQHFNTNFDAVTGWGVGGAARSKVARGKVLRLGTVETATPIVELSQQKKGSFTDRYLAGNVGAGVLKRFNLTFDYQNQTIVFEPNANFDQPGQFDCSGMWINRSALGLEVVDVVAGGPAESAGLQVGDQITAVDGKPASKLALPAFRQRLRTAPPKTIIRLKVQRRQTERTVELHLRQLI